MTQDDPCQMRERSSYWNYRLILHDTDDNPWYGLHEVFYDKGDAVNGWTENPISFICDQDEGPEGIKHDLANAASDADARPPLVLSELEKELGT